MGHNSTHHCLSHLLTAASSRCLYQLCLLPSALSRATWFSPFFDYNLRKGRPHSISAASEFYWPSAFLSHAKPLEITVIHPRTFPTDVPLTPPDSSSLTPHLLCYSYIIECFWMILFWFFPSSLSRKFPCRLAPGKSWTYSTWYFVI